MFWKDANGVRKTFPKVHPMMPYIANTYYYLLLAFAALAAFRFRQDADVRKIVATILCFAFTYAVLHVRNRYRIPILPMVFVLSSLGFWGCVDWAVVRNNSVASLFRRLSPSQSMIR